VEFGWTTAQQRLRSEAADVAQDAAQRYGPQPDSWISAYSKAFAKEMAARGWIGLSWPSSAGGAGRPGIERMIIAEALIRAGAPLGAFWFADRQIGPSLIAFGTDEQRDRFLPPILAGDHTWCIGMSEPDAGSDVASLRTRATRSGDTWVIRGQKIWTSFAALADYCYLICRTSEEGPPHAGISEIIVPMDADGIDVRPIRDMAGGSHFCEVFFNDVEVAAANLVGQEGAAFKQTMRQLEHERGGIDRLVSNARLYELARGRADVTDPLLRQEIARLESTFRIGRLLVYREALGQSPRGFSAATKCYCTAYEQAVADFAGRVFGPDAVLGGDLARGIAYAPAYTIMGGTSGVLHNVMGERILGLPR
jgi:alkylation response protein AidB-like acyl-CoA dehydrogenase